MTIERVGVEVPRLYDALADGYDGRYRRSTDRAEDQILASVLGPLCDGKRVLDLGCGTGLVGRLTRPKLYVGVDGAGHALEIARREIPSGRFVEADLNVWMPNFWVDVVTATFAAHYLDLAHALAIAREALPVGGRIFLHGQAPRYEHRKHYVLHGVRHDHRAWTPERVVPMAYGWGFSDVACMGLNGAWDVLTDHLPTWGARAVMRATAGRRPVGHYHFALSGVKLHIGGP